METLHETYNRIMHETNWYYYHFDQSKSVEILNDSGKCRDFIYTYLRKGEKLTDGDMIMDILPSEDDKRWCHVLSCFFLGIYIYETPQIKGRILNALRVLYNTNDENINKRFLYLWMLTCLFHDIGYSIENGIKLKKNGAINKLIQGLDNPELIPKSYSISLLKHYNQYRLCRWGVNDHGIYGGALLFKHLCELRKRKNASGNSNLDWGEHLIKDFNIAAWAVACHNIFVVKCGDPYEQCYRHFSLVRFIVEDKNRRIKLDQHPILFLLCLADSLEPMKILHTTEDLKSVRVKSDGSSIKINLDNLCPVKKAAFQAKINEVDFWLTDVREKNEIML